MASRSTGAHRRAALAWLDRVGTPAGQVPRPIPGAWVAAAMLTLVVVLAMMLWDEQLRIDPAATTTRLLYLGGALAIGLCIGLRRRATPLQRTVRDTAEYFSTFILLGLIGAVATYPIAASSHGFVDPVLQRADVLLGFDWLAWYRLVAAHPALQLAGRIAYASIYWTPVVILGAFAVTGRQDRARACIATFWLAVVLTLVMYRFMPAIGPLGYLWHGALPYLPESALWQPQLIPPLRQHAIHVIDLGTLRGLVSAPSFHTASAVLYIAAAWPLRRLRWPVLVVNVAMLLSTPVEGTHYLSDMIVGAAVAFTALSLVGWLRAELARERGGRGMAVAPARSRSR